MWVYRILLTLWGALPIALACWALRPVSQREMATFAVRYGIDVTAETLPVMRREIRSSRVGRLAGAAIGLSIHPVLYVIGLEIPNDSAYYGVIGYLLGAFLVALLPRNVGIGVRRASLAPRRLQDYLPAGALVAPAFAVGLSALSVVVYHVEPGRVPFGSSDGTTVALGISVVAALATLTAIRFVVSRAQPVATQELVAVDDAMRTHAVHIFGGAGTAIAYLGAAACLFAMGLHAAPTWLYVTGQVAAVAALAGALGAWAFIGTPWRVPRSSLR
jgi:hypothetical protein